MAICLACSCFRASERNTADENAKSSEDEVKDGAEYGTIQNPPQNIPSKRKFGFALRYFKEKKENETPASDGPSLHSSSNGKTKSKKVVPKKKVSFSWRYGRRKSTSCSGGPTYDYIDAINDPVYSRVDENPSHLHRYDYPTFASYSQSRQPNEPFYTSASQIYSMAGDDPYSSIVSELDNTRGANYDLESNSSAYEVGYEKVAAIVSGAKATPLKAKANGSALRTQKKNLDALYAKINRPSTLEGNIGANNNVSKGRLLFNDERTISLDAQPSTSAAFVPPSTTSNAIETNSSVYQMEESGSGSVGSCYTGTGSSQNPSYRYLTVRESVDVIRERIRQQELANNQQTDDGDLFRLPHREHYYSTIANEYELVGSDDRSFLNGRNIGNNRTATDAEQSEQSSEDQHRQQMFRLLPISSSLTSPLSLFTGSLQPTTSSKSHNTPEKEFPKPPTSPIPNRSLEELRSPLKSRPIILSPTLPLPDSIAKGGTSLYNTSNSGGKLQATVPRDFSNSHPNLLITDNNSLKATQQNGKISNSLTSSHPPPPIILPRVPPISSMNSYRPGTMDAKVSHQRYSYSFDPRTATFVAHTSNISNKPAPESAIMRPPEDPSLGILARRNRISAPTSHARTANFLNAFDAMTPPPLPPLPTPFKASNMPQLMKKATEMYDDSQKNTANGGTQLSSSRPVTSRIPVSARNPATLKLRSRTPSPTAEIGTQTVNMTELSSKLSNSSILSKAKSSNESINQADENQQTVNRRSGRRLSPPPMPVGNDYVSTVDLGSERGWPLSPERNKVNGIRYFDKNNVQNDAAMSTRKG